MHLCHRLSMVVFCTFVLNGLPIGTEPGSEMKLLLMLELVISVIVVVLIIITSLPPSVCVMGVWCKIKMGISGKLVVAIQFHTTNWVYYYSNNAILLNCLWLSSLIILWVPKTKFNIIIIINAVWTQHSNEIHRGCTMRVGFVMAHGFH